MNLELRQGYLYGLLAYGLWGLVPLYFKQIAELNVYEILMHRMAWCALFLAIVITIVSRWGDVVRVLRSPPLLAALVLSASLIAVT